jgi:hypothetical protein
MKTKTENTNGTKTLPYLLLSGAALNFLFWSLYYMQVIKLTDIEDGLVSSFESAFPVADFVMSIFLILAAVYMLRKRSAGGYFMTVSGSMLVYLAALDITFYVSNGYYSSISPAIIVPVCLNVVCLTGGTFALIKSWNFWRLSR